MARVILHSDLNNFYASVACFLNPDLKDKAVVVCGNPEHRHGIVLAKNELAKFYGIKTGDVLWQAHQKCPNLIEVPPDFPRYLEYSNKVKAIYQRYTDQVEPYGIDECWLDVTGSTQLFGSGEAIADQLRQSVRTELGLTISVGVSYNKIFAKLGSDYKKPDATTCITTTNYKQLVWPLDAKDLFFVGRATGNKLAKYGIFTIGQIAQSDPAMLECLFGINGRKLWVYANGQDQAPILRAGEFPEALSIGHGITCTSDLSNPTEVKEVLIFLAQKVAKRLRQSFKLANKVTLTLRSQDLSSQSHQTSLANPCRSAAKLVKTAMDLLTVHYPWQQPIRSLSIQVSHLIPEDQPQQLALWSSQLQDDKAERLEAITDGLCQRYGKQIINRASQLLDLKIPKEYQGDYAVLPGSRV